MAPFKVILIACGSFNPPTNMHLRMFEIARDHFRKFDNYQVIGGVISPVHDSYGKKGLVSATHRCTMLKLALQSSGWVRVSDWECQQESWTPTRQVLEHHQDIINSMLNANNEITLSSPNKRQRNADYSWVPDEIFYSSGDIESVKVKLLCGADLLESFAVPGLWKADDIEDIVNNFGLVVITRDGSNPYKFIYESDVLYKCQNNISIVTEWIANEVSSTKVRRAIQRCESVRYLLQDSVIEFIEQHGLYKNDKDNNNKYEMKSLTFLTPSPTDTIMESPSPLYPTGQNNSFSNQSTMQNGIMKVSGEVKSRGSSSVVILTGYPGAAVKVFSKGKDGISGEKRLSNSNLTEVSPTAATPRHEGQSEREDKKVKSEEVNGEVQTEDGESSKMEEPVARVQIEITKDGIKVISDKETTV